MQADPGERNNIAKAHPELVAKLSRLYEEWYEDISRGGVQRFPIPVGHPEENPVRLHAPQADFSGSLRFGHGPGFAHDWLTGWTDADSKVWFEMDVVRAGSYEVELHFACPKSDAGSTIRLRAGRSELTARVPAAEAPVIALPHRDLRSRERYFNREWGTLPLGQISLPAGRQRLLLEAVSLAGGQVLELKGATLKFLGN